MLPASKKPTLFCRFRCKTCSDRHASARNAPTAGDKNEVEFVSIRAIKEDVVNSLARDA